MPFKEHTAKERMPENQRRMIQELVDEMNKQPEEDLPYEETVPYILAEEVQATGTIRLYAVWKRWEGVSTEDRSRILLEAYGEARPKMVQRVSLVMAFTPDEERKQGIRIRPDQ